MYDVSTLCVHKHYVTAYFSHEMSMDEMMEKGVCVGGGRGSWYFGSWVLEWGGGQRKNNSK